MKMMRNGEVKNYKGKKITKINGNTFMVGGYIKYFKSYYEAKEAIDAAEAEEKALSDIDDYVRSIGGYL